MTRGYKKSANTRVLFRSSRLICQLTAMTIRTGLFRQYEGTHPADSLRGQQVLCD